jgi:hypothetical protein
MFSKSEYVYFKLKRGELADGYNTLFIATGYTTDPIAPDCDRVAVDNLVVDGAGCRDIDPYPLESIQHAVGTFIEGQPLFCGGERYVCESKTRI